MGDTFLAHAVELMQGLGPVEAKRMFGGWGVFHEGLCFAIVMGETLYFKTDDTNRAEFDRRDLEPFTFEKRGERVVTGYRAAPEEAFESARVMTEWAKGAYGAALRKSAPRRRPSRPST
jgi:DNA transformation protein